MHRALRPADYAQLARRWGISKLAAERYGLEVGVSEDGAEWLILPYRNEWGHQVHVQLRGWNEKAWAKYLTQTEPPPGLVWRSWDGSEKPSRICLVEGVLDGIRTGAHVPTIALMGADANADKVKTILAAGAPGCMYDVALDSDVPHKALRLAQSLGLLRTRIVMLPEGKDPADLTDDQLSVLFAHSEANTTHGHSTQDGHVEPERTDAL